MIVCHILSGAALIVTLLIDKFSKYPKNSPPYDDCLNLCFIFVGILLFLGIIDFIVYSQERRQIRNRIDPTPQPLIQGATCNTTQLCCD